MPVTAPSATLSTSKAIKYVGNVALWNALLKEYPQILKPVWVTGGRVRENRTYLVESIDIALRAAHHDGKFDKPEKTVAHSGSKSATAE